MIIKAEYIYKYGKCVKDVRQYEPGWVFHCIKAQDSQHKHYHDRQEKYPPGDVACGCIYQKIGKNQYGVDRQEYKCRAPAFKSFYAIDQ